MRSITSKIIIILMLIFIVFTNKKYFANCSLKAVSEIFIPGLGYALSGNYYAAGVWGGARFLFVNKVAQHSRNYTSKYGKEPQFNRYTTTENKDGETYTINNYYYDRDEFLAEHYNSLFLYTGFIGFWDLLKHDCNTGWGSARAVTAPLAINKWYNNITIYIGLSFTYKTPSQKKNSTYQEYYYTQDLSPDAIKDRKYLQYYLVGVIEEIIFRDLIQASFFEWYVDLGLQENSAWHSGVFSAAAIFGLAHDGTFGTANQIAAFLMGIILGYTYQPAPQTFSLESAAALHSFWNMSVFAHRNKKFIERNQSNASTSIPLITATLSF